MPEFRYILLTNSLSSKVAIYPTVSLDGDVILASDSQTPNGSTADYDLSAFAADGADSHNVAIGAFVATSGGRQAESGSFMTITTKGDIYGYFEMTGAADGPTMEFKGYGPKK